VSTKLALLSRIAAGTNRRPQARISRFPRPPHPDSLMDGPRCGRIQCRRNLFADPALAAVLVAGMVGVRVGVVFACDATGRGFGSQRGDCAQRLRIMLDEPKSRILGTVCSR
jgi:hypothetical protein